MRLIRHVTQGAGFVAALLFATHAASLAIFSAGPGQYGVPETISLAPSGFGTFGGKYFIPDARAREIWYVSDTGGQPTGFLAPATTDSSRGGLFLPSGWGVNSGNFVTVGLHVTVFDSNRNATLPFGAQTANFSTPLIAPTGFGAYGGHLFVSDQNNQVWQVAPSGGDLTLFKNFQSDGSPFNAVVPFGLEFTPSDFGAFGNSLLLSDGGNSIVTGGQRYGAIVALSASGTPRLFAAVPLKDSGSTAQSQNGLRQMLFAPDDYFMESLGIPGKLLLVSVSGSGQGGGVLGDIVAIDVDGAIVASLRDDLGLTKFDPRGMAFTAGGDLLVSDTSDPILLVSPGDFQHAPASAPVPVTAALTVLGLTVLAGVRRSRAKPALAASTESGRVPRR